MTCVVGVVSRKRVWLGGDSAVTDDDGVLLLTGAPKAWRIGAWLFGFAGDAADYSALAFDLAPAPPPTQIVRYVHVDLVAAVRQALERANCAQANHTLMVGVRGRLFLIADGGADEVRGDYCAIGSGAHPALGSLYTSRGSPAEARVRWALEASEAHCSSVRRPWTILSAS
jgi:ATP-dependent protease HslVU (ClpYQ) peptidase subunit